LGDLAILQRHNIKKPWDVPGGLMPNDEFRVLFNMEMPLGSQANSKPRTSGLRFRSDPVLLQKIKDWSPGFAALATNHILDSGEEGLAQTIELLNQAGFETFGAGSTQEEVNQPLTWKTKEGSLAIINWVFPETNPDWFSIPGPSCWPGLEAAESIIRDLKSQVDWVVLFLHWSDECFSYPRPEDRHIARALAQMGADMIIGHHPHVVRGMEVFGNCPVLYSIGNYFFSEISVPNGGGIVRQAPRNRESLGVLLTFEQGKKLSYQLLSLWNDHTQTRRDQLRRATRRLERSSLPFQKLDAEQYHNWYKEHRRRFDRWGYRWHFGIWSLGMREITQRIAHIFQSS
jgi:hypothetical protein